MPTRNSRDVTLRAIADDLRRSRATLEVMTPTPRVTQVIAILTEAGALLAEEANASAGRVEYFSGPSHDERRANASFDNRPRGFRR